MFMLSSNSTADGELLAVNMILNCDTECFHSALDLPVDMV
jgi:hypothetical protein